MKLKGKVALVTGAGRGIGQAHALRLARLGANVVVNDINLESFKEFDEDIGADSLVELLTNQGVEALGVESSVTDQDAVNDLVEQVVSKFGRIDILVNNAGGIAGDFKKSYASSFSYEDMMNTMERNLMGTIFCCQAAAKHMKEQQSGKIVNTSSQGGMRGETNGIYATYGVAKAGVIQYTRYLAQELGRDNINVNCISPAYVATERLMRQSFKNIKSVRKELKVPLDRFAEPDDIAKVMEFLVTDLSDYVTGQNIPVCGGAINF